MGNFLDSLRDGFEMVVDKTEEYSKIGKLKVDIMNLKRNTEKKLAELGEKTFVLLDENASAKVADNEDIKALLEDVQNMKKELEAKEAEIERVRQEKEQEREERRKSRETEAETQAEPAQDVKTEEGEEQGDVSDANIIEDDEKKND